MNVWYVYIVRCADDTFYAGMTNDVERRIGEHNGDGRLGAKYTRARRPVKLEYQQQFETRSAACKFEWHIKKLNRKQKERLIQDSLCVTK